MLTAMARRTYRGFRKQSNFELACSLCGLGAPEIPDNLPEIWSFTVH